MEYLTDIFMASILSIVGVSEKFKAVQDAVFLEAAGGEAKSKMEAEKTTVTARRKTRIAFGPGLALPQDTGGADRSLGLLLDTDTCSGCCTNTNAFYWSMVKRLGVASGSFVAAYHDQRIGNWHILSVNCGDSSLKGVMIRFWGYRHSLSSELSS